jgi:hypothetical protein
MDGVVTTMNLTWAVTVVSFITAGAGAYLGSYLKRKGENLATHEDIDKLVDQVKAITTATKEIEATISSDLWDRQKQWELKRDILFDATKRLCEVENKLSTIHTYWRMRLNGEVDESARITVEHQCVTEWHSAIKSLEEAGSLVNVSCSKDTMTAFAGLCDLLNRTAGKIVSGDVEIYATTKDERNKKFATARVQIRTELGIKLDLVPQPSKPLGSISK